MDRRILFIYLFIFLNLLLFYMEKWWSIPDPEGFECSTTLCWMKIQPPDDVATRETRFIGGGKRRRVTKRNEKSRLVSWQSFSNRPLENWVKFCLAFSCQCCGATHAPLSIFEYEFSENDWLAPSLYSYASRTDVSWHFRPTNRSFGWSDRNSCSFSSSRRRCRWSTVWSIQIRCTHDKFVGERVGIEQNFCRDAEKNNEMRSAEILFRFWSLRRIEVW